MQTELLFPDYINEKLIAIPEYTLQRMDTVSGRHYMVRPNDSDGEFLLPSITTIVRSTSPLSPFIINKMIEMGKEKWDEYLYERMEYGTNMHILIGEFIRRKTMNLPLTQEEIDDIGMHNRGFNLSIFNKFKEDYYSDLIAFAQFYFDYKIEPIALEIPLASIKEGFAGTLDMPCKMQVPTKGFWGEVYKTGPNKGNMKETTQDVEVIALVDFKSGRHGFYRENEVQLKMCEVLFRENFPKLSESATIKLYNWSPKSWIKEPGYNLTDQTDKVTNDNYMSRVKLFRSEFDNSFKSKRVIFGTLELGTEPIEMYLNETIF